MIKATDVVTEPHPKFMTDWQGPWSVFMTQAEGISTLHETVFESRFSYVSELHKMGAKLNISLRKFLILLPIIISIGQINQSRVSRRFV